MLSTTHFSALEETVLRMPEELRSVFAVCVENSRKVGEPLSCRSSRCRDSPKAKLLSRLEELDERVSDLEEVEEKLLADLTEAGKENQALKTRLSDLQDDFIAENLRASVLQLSLIHI